MLVHGLSKSGKSTLAVTAPAPRLLMDVESASRFLPIRSIEWDPKISPPPEYDGTWDTVVVPTRSWEDVQQAYAWLASGQHPFKSLIIDSVSELQVRYIERTSGRTQPQLQGWGDIFRAVSGLLRDLRDLTMSPVKPLECVVLTAMTKQDREGRWVPYVSGQLQTVLPYLWDVTAYLWAEDIVNEFSGEVTTTVRRLLTQRTPAYEAGERVQGRLPKVVENPDIVEMINTIFPPLGPEGSGVQADTTTTNEVPTP